MKGSEHNDIFENEVGVIRTRTNHSGGIQGGIGTLLRTVLVVAFRINWQYPQKYLETAAGRYRVKHPDLKPIHASVMALLRGFDGYTVGHVPRELNKDADRLSNVAIDGPSISG